MRYEYKIQLYIQVLYLQESLVVFICLFFIPRRQTLPFQDEAHNDSLVSDASNHPDDREELDFMLDAEMEVLNINKRSFTKWDSDSDEDDITDADLKKIIIVTQVS